jgi:hypothetical protein
MELRLCLLYVAGIFDMRPDHIHEKTVLGGLASSLLRFVAGFNVTYVFPDVNRMGATIDRKVLVYDGCIGSVQRNESDFAIIVPVDGYYGPTVQPWIPIWSDFALIGTVYHKVQIDADNSEKTRVLQFLNAYALSNWLLTFASLVILASVMACSMQIRRNMRRTISNIIQGLDTRLNRKEQRTRLRKICDRVFMMLISCILKQHSSSGKLTASSISCLYLLTTVLCFFTTYFLTSMINTEMVILKRPVTYDRYQDLLKNDTTPLWLDELDDQRSFRDAPDGTPAKELWDRAVGRGISKSLMTTQNMDVSWLLSIANDMFSKKSVSLSNSALTHVCLSNICHYIRSEGMFKQSNPYIKRDESAVESIRSLIGSSLAHPVIRKRVTRIGRWFMETDPAIPMFIRRYGAVVVPSGSEKIFSSVEECKSGVIVMPQIDLLPVTLYHFSDLFLVFITAVVLCLVVALIEKCSRKS